MPTVDIPSLPRDDSEISPHVRVLIEEARENMRRADAEVRAATKRETSGEVDLVIAPAGEISVND